MSVVMKTNYESVLKITVILLFLPVLLIPAFALSPLTVLTTDRDVYYNNDYVVISGVLKDNVSEIELIFSYEDDKFEPISRDAIVFGSHLIPKSLTSVYLGGINFTLPTNELHDDYTGIITVNAIVGDYLLAETEFYYTNQNPINVDFYNLINSLQIKYDTLLEKYNVASASTVNRISEINDLNEKYDYLLEKFSLQIASVDVADEIVLNDTPFRDTIDTTLEINIDKESYHTDESVIVYGTVSNGENDTVHLKIYDGKLFRFDRDLTVDDGEYSFTFSLYHLPLGEYTVSVLYDDGYVDEYVEQTSFLIK